MNDFFKKESKRTESSSVTTPTTVLTGDTMEGDHPKEELFDGAFNPFDRPATAAERQAARRNARAQGPAEPRKWGSVGTLHSLSKTRQQFPAFQDDSQVRLFSDQNNSAFDDDPFAAFPAPASKSPRGARMKLVPAKKLGGASPFQTGRKNFPNEIAQMPDQQTFNNCTYSPPAKMYNRGQPMDKDAFDRLSMSMSQLDSRATSKNHRINNNLKDALGIDPFSDDHSLGSYGDFDDDDGGVFVSGNASVMSGTASVMSARSARSTRSNASSRAPATAGAWNQLVLTAKQKHEKRDKFESLVSDVEDMRKSVHEQEKEMQLQLQKRDELIKKLADQLEVAKGSAPNSTEKKSKRSKEKKLSKSEHKTGSTSGAIGSHSERGSSKSRRRGSVGALGGRSSSHGDKVKKKSASSHERSESRRSDKPSRRKTTDDGKKSKKRSGGTKSQRRKDEVTDAALAMLIGDVGQKNLEEKLKRADSKSSKSKKKGSNRSLNSKESKSSKGKKASSDRSLSKASSSHSGRSKNGLDTDSTHKRRKPKKKKKADVDDESDSFEFEHVEVERKDSADGISGAEQENEEDGEGLTNSPTKKGLMGKITKFGRRLSTSRLEHGRDDTTKSM